MSRIELPLGERLGLTRSVCACPDCSAHCRGMPGMLVPTDLDRLYEVQKLAGEEKDDWARRTLRASPGARVVLSGATKISRIPTLVPARQADGQSCINLTPDGMCRVHAVSPFGCAYFDSHEAYKSATAKVTAALVEIYNAHRNRTQYAEIWQMLDQQGLTALGPAASRAAVQKNREENM